MKKQQSNNQALPALCDADLYSRFVAGENACYTVLYHRYSARLLGYIRSLVGIDNQAADDVFQETFLRLYRERNRHDQDDLSGLLKNVGGWLFRVARNLSLNQLRSENYLASLPEEYNDQLITTTGEAFPRLYGEALEEEELLEKVHRVVETLPVALRDVFMLREVNGMSYEETAAIIGCSMEAARMRLSRARSAIRAALAPDLNRINS